MFMKSVSLFIFHWWVFQPFFSRTFETCIDDDTSFALSVGPKQIQYRIVILNFYVLHATAPQYLGPLAHLIVALNSLFCADVPLSNYSLHSLVLLMCQVNTHSDLLLSTTLLMHYLLMSLRIVH